MHCLFLTKSYDVVPLPLLGGCYTECVLSSYLLVG
jgi:hypothetical protein